MDQTKIKQLLYKKRKADDAYFKAISSGWGEALKKAFDSLADYSFGG